MKNIDFFFLNIFERKFMFVSNVDIFIYFLIDIYRANYKFKSGNKN